MVKVSLINNSRYTRPGSSSYTIQSTDPLPARSQQNLEDIARATFFHTGAASYYTKSKIIFSTEPSDVLNE